MVWRHGGRLEYRSRVLPFPVVVGVWGCARRRGRFLVPGFNPASRRLVGCLVYVLAGVVCALRAGAAVQEENGVVATKHGDDGISELRPSAGQRLQWFGLAACGCVMLLSVTNLICQEIAVVPFLWVLPLGLYLISFILCFQEKPIYRRGLFHAAFALAAAWGGIEFLRGEGVKTLAQMGWFDVLLVAACMVYPRELAKREPPPPPI